MDTRSLWVDITKETTEYPELSDNIDVDVVIVGAGITGVTAAVELIERGKKVAILEANKVGLGTTGFSTGNLYVPIQPYYQSISKKFDFNTVKMVAESRREAINYIEKVCDQKNIQCNFTRRPMFLYTNQNDQLNFIEQEFDILQKTGIEIKKTDSLPLELPFKKAMIMPNQARFNPMKYVIDLAKTLHQKGCYIFENSRVLHIEEKGAKCVFKTHKAHITAKNGIIATHTPIGINPIHFYTAAYRSYVVAVELKNKIYPELNYWGLGTDHYPMSTHSRAQQSPDLLVIAGSHHKTGQSDNAMAHFTELERFLRKHFEVEEVKYRWSAQHYHSGDGLPFIGLAHSYKNVYEATGFFADGLVYGTIAGTVLGRSISDSRSESTNIYNSERSKFVSSFPFLFKENLNVFLQYMKDMPKLSKPNFSEIKVGDGKVCSINGEKCGVYRDKNEKLHVVSAVCTHMKCIVKWNNAEKTWDCPCHGSRFNVDGKVLEGPAILNLTNQSQLINEFNNKDKFEGY